MSCSPSKIGILIVQGTQGPHSQIVMTGGEGGPTEVHILYPKKSQLENLSTQKIHYLFLAYPKKSPSLFFTTPKNPSFFFATQKNSFVAKISDPKKSLGHPPVIKICEWGPLDREVLASGEFNDMIPNNKFWNWRPWNIDFSMLDKYFSENCSVNWWLMCIYCPWKTQIRHYFDKF